MSPVRYPCTAWRRTLAAGSNAIVGVYSWVNAPSGSGETQSHLAAAATRHSVRLLWVARTPQSCLRQVRPIHSSYSTLRPLTILTTRICSLSVCLSVCVALQSSQTCSIFIFFLYHYVTKIFALVSSLETVWWKWNFSTMCRMLLVGVWSGSLKSSDSTVYSILCRDWRTFVKVGLNSVMSF